MSSTDAWHIALAVFLVLTGVALAYVLFRVSQLLGDVEKHLDETMVEVVPMLGKAAEVDARDARAAAGYWRADYAAIAPQHDANGVVTETNPAIPLLTANAAFRATQATSDRLDTVRRLETVIKGYSEVLKAPACGAGDRACDGRAADAAFNYEYAIRNRDAT